MTSLVRRFASRGSEERSSSPLGFQQWVDMINYNNTMYPVGLNQTLLGNREELYGDYGGLISGAFHANGVVFACMYARMLHFTEARFQFRQMRNGRPGDMFGTAALAPLETPWENGTTGDLLARMIQDVDLAGNSYVVRQGDRLSRLRPDWVSILLGSKSDRKGWVPGDPDTEVIGYFFKPGGLRSSAPEMLFDVRDVAHFAPIPDPQATYRGMSWLSPLLREIQADNAMSSHRLKFFDQGATVNLAVKLPKEAAPTMEQFQEWVKVIREGHEGVRNAYRTMFLGMGADVTPIGTDMTDFGKVQGAGEVRIAVAARVPATLLGISEGLQGSTLNAGNYASARRNFADGLLRPLWRNAAGSLASIIQVPSGAELWYDDRDISFLKEDVKDTAEIQQTQSQTVVAYVNSGFTPESAVQAVAANDVTRLVHTGMLSVQLQQPGTQKPMMNGGTQQPATTANGSHPMVAA